MSSDYTSFEGCYAKTSLIYDKWAGYVSKKFDTPGVFSLMSRRPGIGLPWFRENSEPGQFCVLPSGDGKVVRGSVPRSAFPNAVLDSKILDVDEYSVGPLTREQQDEFRWAMDYALKHPASKRCFKG